MQDIITPILQKIKPSKEEVDKLKEVSNTIIEKINKIAKELKIEAYAILVGSADRGTWISGEHDLDIFITFPEDTSREDLEKIGLYIAKKAVENYEERYAEHPYIHAYYKDYEIDIVPCFRVSSSAKIKSAVDRTPFHNLYVKENINGLEDEVLLLKQFCRGIGVYGSELKTQGFSGYL
ncbi:MAG: nucleotidyltransferase domain-containing protein, partial [Methanosarcinales archaeon]